MALAEPALPFGLRDVKLKKINADGTLGAAVDLPNSRTFSFTEAEDFEELRGDDKVVAVRGRGANVDWDLEGGGISFDAWAVLSGAAAGAISGVAPNQTRQITKKSTDSRPYFQVEGQAISDSGGDLHVVLFRCRATGDLSGEMSDGEFWLSGASGTAVPAPGTDNLYQMTINETPTAIA